MGLLGLDTNRAPNWPGLRTLLQLLPPQDSDVGLPLLSFPLFTFCGRTLVQKSGNMDLRPSYATNWEKSSPQSQPEFSHLHNGTMIYMMAVLPATMLS